MTSINGTLRHAGVPLPIAIDSGGLHYETGGALVLRKVAGAIGSSRVQGLDAEIAFAPGPVVRAAIRQRRRWPGRAVLHGYRASRRPSLRRASSSACRERSV